LGEAHHGSNHLVGIGSANCAPGSRRVGNGTHDERYPQLQEALGDHRAIAGPMPIIDYCSREPKLREALQCLHRVVCRDDISAGLLEKKDEGVATTASFSSNKILGSSCNIIFLSGAQVRHAAYATPR